MKINLGSVINIPAGGGTFNLLQTTTIPNLPFLPDPTTYQVINTATSLTGNVVIQLTSPIVPFQGMEFDFQYKGDIISISNSATITIFGYTLTNLQAMSYLNFKFTYNLNAEKTSGAWTVTVSPFKIGVNSFYSKVTIPSASILTGNSTPVLVLNPNLLPTQMLNVSNSSFGYLTFVTTAYTTHFGQQLLMGDTAVPPNLADQTLLTDSSLLASTKSRGAKFASQGNSGATNLMMVPGDKLYWNVATGNPAAGDGILNLYLKYDIIDL